MKNQDEIFAKMMYEFMLNKSDEIERDRTMILNRIALSRLDSDSYYDLLVNDIRRDYSSMLFRQITSIMKSYLDV